MVEFRRYCQDYAFTPRLQLEGGVGGIRDWTEREWLRSSVIQYGISSRLLQENFHSEYSREGGIFGEGALPEKPSI